MKYTRKERAIARKLERAANEEGTIQAHRMVDLAPGMAGLHTTTTVALAFEALTGKEYDPEGVR